MKKVVFTYYPLYIHYNYGISLLAKLCRNKGIKAYIVPLGGDFLSKIKTIYPDYVGCSFVCEEDFYKSIPYVKQLKKLGITMLAGGVYLKKGVFIPKGLFDYVCRGEGEMLPDFIENGDTAVFDSNYHHKDISDLPLPDYSTVNGNEFSRGYSCLDGLRIIPYSSSRGCPYLCSFCESKYHSKAIRIRKNIMGDLDYLYERYAPDMFYFIDELLPYYNEEWLNSFHGNKYNFMGYIRADIKQEILEFLCKNGLTFCAFGVESGSEDYRKNVLKKDISNIEIFKTVETLKKYNVQYAPFFMTNAPYETDESRVSTFAMYNVIGGYPTMWEYLDVDKKVCSLNNESVSAYAKKIGTSEVETWEVLGMQQVGINTKGDSFFSYEILPDAIFVNHVWGDGQWIWNELEMLCKKHNKKHVRFIIKPDGHVRGFQKKWKFNISGYIMEREVGV